MASNRSSTQTRIIPKDVSPADVEHFSTLPLAQPILNNPSFSIFPITYAAQPNGERHDTLMAHTWNTPDTITHMLTLTKRTSSEPTEICRFYTFGSGLNALVDRLHGGVLATILDSTLGTIALVESRRASRDDGARVVTLQLNIRYKSPMPTPGSLMVTARVTRIEDGGRKIWVEGSVKGGENVEITHATAEGMWLRIKPSGGKL